MDNAVCIIKRMLYNLECVGVECTNLSVVCCLVAAVVSLPSAASAVPDDAGP